MTDPILVLAVLCAVVAIAELLVRHTALKHLGSALLVILIGAILANTKVIPSASNSISLYDGIFGYVAPLSLFYLLLEVNVKNLKHAGLPMLAMFLIGTAGTVLGVWVTLNLMGADIFGDKTDILGGMFTATYTGGGLNFNTVALHYNFMEEGILYAGAVAVDNIMTALWMLACLVIPLGLQKLWPRPNLAIPKTELDQGSFDVDTVYLKDFALLIALGLCCWVFSKWMADLTAGWGFEIPDILILTTIALIFAQIPKIASLSGSRVLGMLGIYLFLTVVGAFCEISALGAIGDLAINLLLFTFGLVSIHALVTFGLGGLLGYDWQLISVASQANIGGSTSALALTESFKRQSLLIPAVLVGSLGNAIGSYLGFMIVGLI